jgi:hypothetical protein
VGAPTAKSALLTAVLVCDALREMLVAFSVAEAGSRPRVSRSLPGHVVDDAASFGPVMAAELETRATLPVVPLSASEPTASGGKGRRPPCPFASWTRNVRPAAMVPLRLRRELVVAACCGVLQRPAVEADRRRRDVHEFHEVVRVGGLAVAAPP